MPDHEPTEAALQRTTHMGIGAHQDDLEVMTLHGILQCFQSRENWFTGVTVTDGRGSPRAHEYAGYTDEQMREVRRVEQKKAAFLGEYAAAVFLDYPSKAVKNPDETDLVGDLKTLIDVASPAYLYTHNPADKHDTHVGVAVAVIQAARQLPRSKQPKALYGCEVWRSLDWMLDEDKVVFDVSARENVGLSLLGLFDSQISGGKRYDLATYGRKKANATYHASHDTDQAKLLEFAMDLTPLIRNPSLDIVEYVDGFIRHFADDVKQKLSKRLGKLRG